eukprot:g44740.t1
MLLVTVLGCGRCRPVDGEPPCAASGRAKYSLIFTGKWSRTAFPKQYPLYRPPAQWSPLMVVTHSSDYHMWRVGEYASNGVREFAEKGEAWSLMREVEASGEKIQSVYGVFSAPAIPNGIEQTSTEFEVHARHSLTPPQEETSSLLYPVKSSKYHFDKVASHSSKLKLPFKSR